MFSDRWQHKNQVHFVRNVFLGYTNMVEELFEWQASRQADRQAEGKPMRKIRNFSTLLHVKSFKRFSVPKMFVQLGSLSRIAVIYTIFGVISPGLCYLLLFHFVDFLFFLFNASLLIALFLKCKFSLPIIPWLFSLTLYDS